jgi:hypothetical protein
MVLKFFRRKEVNPEPGGLAYLLRNPTARVIRGNPEITQALIDASPPRMAQRFTAGVLNGCPPMMNAKKEQALIDELEMQFLAGRGRESMPWCVVAHGAEEKHFVVPNYDPVFQKVVDPYIDRIDRKGFRAWVEHYSLRHGLPVPNDCLRIEPDFAHLRFAADQVEFLRQIWSYVKFWVAHNLLKTRDDLLLLLTGAGFKVRSEKHAGGPLEQPVVMGPRGTWLPLTGSIYYRPDLGKPKAPVLAPKYSDFVPTRLAMLRKIIEDRFDFRAWHLIGRLYGRGEQSRVIDGGARQHFYSLVQEKLLAERRALMAFPSANLAHLIQVTDSFKAGLQPVIPGTTSVGKTDVPLTQVEQCTEPTMELKSAPIPPEAVNKVPPAVDKKQLYDDGMIPFETMVPARPKRSKKRLPK